MALPGRGELPVEPLSAITPNGVQLLFDGHFQSKPVLQVREVGLLGGASQANPSQQTPQSRRFKVVLSDVNSEVRVLVLGDCGQVNETHLLEIRKWSVTAAGKGKVIAITEATVVGIIHPEHVVPRQQLRKISDKRHGGVMATQEENFPSTQAMAAIPLSGLTGQSNGTSSPPKCSQLSSGGVDEMPPPSGHIADFYNRKTPPRKVQLPSEEVTPPPLAKSPGLDMTPPPIRSQGKSQHVPFTNEKLVDDVATQECPTAPEVAAAAFKPTDFKDYDNRFGFSQAAQNGHVARAGTHTFPSSAPGFPAAPTQPASTEASKAPEPAATIDSSPLASLDLLRENNAHEAEAAETVPAEPPAMPPPSMPPPSQGGGPSAERRFSFPEAEPAGQPIPATPGSRRLPATMTRSQPGRFGISMAEERELEAIRAQEDAFSSQPSQLDRESVRGAVQRTQGTITPIASLSVYATGRWKIKARVTLKSEVRNFNGARGEGKLFKIDIADKTGTISCVFFGKAVDRFSPMIRPGQVYYFSGGAVKMANKRFDRGDHVINFDERTSVELAEEDEGLPHLQYDFVALNSVKDPDRVLGTLLDVKGVIYEVQEPLTFTPKSGAKDMTKRELGLWDPSGGPEGTCIVMTLWGEKALGGEFTAGSVIFLKDAKLGEWQDQRNLSSPLSFDLNPDSAEAFELLRRWEEHQRTRGGLMPGLGRQATGSGQRKTIQACEEEDRNLTLPPAFGQAAPEGVRFSHRHTVVANICRLPDRLPCYPACTQVVERAGGGGGATSSQRTCSKKMTQDDASQVWTCNAGHTGTPTWRYFGNFQVVDHTESIDVKIGDSAAVKLFGHSADKYKEIWDACAGDSGSGELLQIHSKVLWKKVLLRLRAQKELWQEAEQVRYTADEVSLVSWADDARVMLKEVMASVS